MTSTEGHGTPEPLQDSRPRRRRRILLGAGLALVVALGLACWFIFLPAWRVNRAIDHYRSSSSGPDLAREAVESLGGPKRAAKTLSTYLHLPAFATRHRLLAVELLGACGEDAAPELARLLRDDGASLRLRRTAAIALGKTGKRGVEPLLPLLSSEDRELQTAAAKSLGQIGDPRAVAPLVAMLRDKGKGNVIERDDLVRIAAVKALGGIGDSRAVVPLIEILPGRYFPLHRATTKALGQIRDPRAVRPLIAAMKAATKRWGYWGQTSSALVQIGEPSVEPLIEALQDKDRHHQITVTLARIGMPAIARLKEALRDERKNVREGAKEALKDISKIARQAKDKKTWEAAERALQETKQ